MLNEARRDIEEELGFDQNSPTVTWIDDWYTRYSYVLLKAFHNLRQIVIALTKHSDLGGSLLERIYGLMFASIRYMEGVSWRYSQMLIHDQLEQHFMVNLKVTFNLLLRIEQSFREDRNLASLTKTTDVEACFLPAPLFQRASSLDNIDRLICQAKDADTPAE